jgi:RNA polymerase sigma-70 factor (ECF subfamily)
MSGYTETMKYTEADFENIYRATYTHVSKHVFFKVQSLQDAQDIVQDLYYALYRHMQQCVETIENPLAYLVQMANNELSKYYKDKALRPVTIIDDEIDLFESIPDNYELELDVLDKTVADQLWVEINRLPDLERNLLVARFRFDLNYYEIAKQYNLPETTIKSKVYRSLEILKKKFRK